jgi:hypothetical protein
MATITWNEAKSYAKEAGFSGPAVDVVAAIAYAESRYVTNARNVNKDGSVDRGVLQINNRAHPDVSNSCADNPLCAFKAAFKISNGGHNFTPWTTYTKGTYAAYLRGVPASGGSSSGSGSSGSGSGGGGNFWTDPNPADWGKEVGSSLTSGLNNIGPNIANALMDAGRSMLPYLVILAVLLFGAVLVYSGVVKQEARAVTGGLAGGN